MGKGSSVVIKPADANIQVQSDPCIDRVQHQHQQIEPVALLTHYTHARLPRNEGIAITAGTSTGQNPGRHAGTGIVGEWIRRGKLGNCIKRFPFI